MDYRQFSENFLAAMRVGDKDTMAGMLHPEFEVVEAVGLPYGGDYKGIDGWMALCKAVVRTWSDFQLNFIEYGGESEESLVVHFAISGRSRKTDKSFESEVLELWRFKDDKLIGILPFYFDTHLLVSADTE